MKQEIKEVCIKPMNVGRVKVPLVGKTPLLMDRFPPDVKQAILNKQTGTKKSAKEVRNVENESKEAIHYCGDGSIGFPSAGFKAGMIESTSFVGDKMFSKKLIKGIQIVNAVNGLVPLKFKKQNILEHNIASNTKHTPQFHDWSCDLEIEFDQNNVSAQDIATLINYAGHYSGVGIWSPRCKSGGSYGMYSLAKKI